jgi:Domain of unknown function (DUF305)
MIWSPRSPVLSGAVVFAVIFTIGAAFLISLHDGSPLETGICSMADPANAIEAPFLLENSAAMMKMMKGMGAKPSGDVDADFVATMVPHHQGAIDMAGAVLRYGHNEQLRRLAQEIIVTQQQEIVAMRLNLCEPLGPSAAAPTLVGRRRFSPLRLMCWRAVQ